MMEKGREKEKVVMNVHYAQFREMKEFVIFCLAVLNGRAYQTRFKSEQPIFAALGMLLFYIILCILHTQKCTDGWSMRS